MKGNFSDIVGKMIIKCVRFFPETPGTAIFYTVDNARPDPYTKIGENTTMVYRQPFMLRAGRRYIKAMAVSK